MKTIAALTAGLLAASSAAAYASVVTTSENEFLDMGFEELLSVELTSGSRRTQSIEDSAASVFVISQDDIRRSPARNVPELLRMVPGVQVARVDYNNYQVSVRGGNQLYANKLLVMIDGRSVYTPTFGGVFWDQHDLLLEDVDRIEVVRGPGGTVWGANATNGVINIITKSAQETDGLYINAEYGDEDEPTAGLRVGTKLRGGGAVRVSALYSAKPDISPNEAAFEAFSATGDPLIVDGPNDYETGKLSARLDQPLGELTTLMVSAAVQKAGFGAAFGRGAGFLQAHVLGRLERQVGNGSVMVQAFADHSDRSGYGISLLTNTYDVDMAHDFSLLDRHEMVWGAGFRFQSDQFTKVAQDEAEDDWRASFFAQDEISFRDDTLRLTIGTKLEYNSITGFEYQPNLRGLWRVSERQTLWGALSRNVRTPSRSDRSVQFQPDPTPAAAFGQLLTVLGSEDVDAETAYTAEIGYRSRFTDRVSFEGSIFATHYEDLIVETGSGLVLPSPFAPVRVNTLTNDGDAFAYGGELAVNVNPIDRLTLQLAYSYIDLQVNQDTPPLVSLPAATAVLFTEDDTAEHLVSLRTSLDVTRQLTASSWLRYTSEPFSERPTDERSPEGGFDLDLRLTYAPTSMLRASLIGENLLDDDETYEARSYISTITEPSPVDRRLTAKIELDF